MPNECSKVLKRTMIAALALALAGCGASQPIEGAPPPSQYRTVFSGDMDRVLAVEDSTGRATCYVMIGYARGGISCIPWVDTTPRAEGR